MPVVSIEAPRGITLAARKKMVRKITLAVKEAYSIGETWIFLREYPRENVAINGVLRSEIQSSRRTAVKAPGSQVATLRAG